MDTAREEETLLLPEEVAERLRVKLTWVYMAARDGMIPCVRVGRWVRFREADVAAFIDKGGAADDQ